jgi:putative serine protease PepD
MTENLSPEPAQHSTGNAPASSPAGSAALPGSVATEPGPAAAGSSEPRPIAAQQPDEWTRPATPLPAAPAAPASTPPPPPASHWAQTSQPTAAQPASGQPYSGAYQQTAYQQTANQQNPYQQNPYQPDPYGQPGGAWPPAGGPSKHAVTGSRGRLVAGLTAGAIALAAVSGGVGAATTRWLDGGTTSTTVITRDTAPVAQTKAQAGTAEAAAEVISRSTVTIAVTGTDASTGRTGQATGSGVVLRADGYIITNNHVVALAANGGSVTVQLPDGSSRPAEVVGTDPTNDLAVVKLKDTSGLKAATFGDSSSLKLGQPVLAMGAPLGLSGTVTEGIVSAVNRPVRTGDGNGQDAVIDAVQTDAAINPGNSGGPLVDMSGRVVGINSAIATVSGASAGGGQSGNIGVGFAIPANDAVKVAQQLIDKGSAQHATLGVSAQNSQDGSGAVIQEVQANTPAASAGLRNGDQIVKVGDRAVVDVDSLVAAVRDHDPGSKVDITYKRDGKQATVSVTLVGRGN